MTDASSDWAWSQELRGTTKLVLLAIVRRVRMATQQENDAAGLSCTLTKQDLTDDTGMVNRTISTALGELERAGLVALNEAGGWKRRITLLVDR